MLSSTSKQATSLSKQTTGAKGSDIYDTTGNELLDLSVMLVRGLSREQLWATMAGPLGSKNVDSLVDLVVLAFLTRNIRGGKGERDLFYQMIEKVFSVFPILLEKLLPLIPQYGSWLDILHMAKGSGYEKKVVYMKVFADQLRKDALVEEGKSISLAAKWAPREKADKLEAQILASLLFGQIERISDRMRAYRKYVANLNRRLHTTEIAMCANHYAEIKPKEVPGRCMMKNRLAFLNELGSKSRKGHFSGDLRYPDREDRMEAREHFQEFFAAAAQGKVKMNGAETVYPHEVIAKVQRVLSRLYSANTYNSKYSDDDDDERTYLVSEAEMNLLVGQWRGFVEKAKGLGALKNCLAMCDFSGSMDGRPKLICTALGLLVAEVSGSNKILTFDSQPKWHQFPEGDIFKKIESITHSMGQGLSTDFQKAMDMVLADIVARRLKPEEIPKDLLVFTDMGWDQACGSNESSSYTGNSYRRNVKTQGWQTHIEMIRESFRSVGEDMWGVPFVPPRIVIWNLRADYKDFHATADQEGVVMLSGWSPSLFKVLQEKGVVLMTPNDALRAQLDDPMYNDVRAVVRPIFQRILEWAENVRYI